MQLNEFINNLYSQRGNYGKVASVASYFDKQIVVNEQGEYFVDGDKLEQQFSSLEEVKEYIDIQEEALQTKINLYEGVSETKVASIIKRHTDAKVTNQLIESYIQQASSRHFTIDPIVLEMRSTIRTDSEIDGKITFRLEDGKQIALSENSVKKIGELLNILEDKEEVLNYMRQNHQNFLSVLKLI